MNLKNRVLSILTERLLRRAKRTPYFHLEGYMNRYWLVPYRQRIERREQLTDTLSVVYYDGTGPVNFRRRPIAWLLQRFDIAVRVHEIVASDDDRALHDHPWDYWSLILHGGYTEISSAGRVWYGPGSFIRHKAEHRHRLRLERPRHPAFPNAYVLTGPPVPCLTLFVMFRKRQSWGFFVDGEKINWRDYRAAD